MQTKKHSYSSCKPLAVNQIIWNFYEFLKPCKCFSITLHNVTIEKLVSDILKKIQEPLW